MTKISGPVNVGSGHVCSIRDVVDTLVDRLEPDIVEFVRSQAR